MTGSLDTHDIVVVGGGIVGLATANSLLRRFPGADVVLLEKESEFGAHQTGRNSGVIHSGIYYTPGSLKAGLSVAGGRAMVEFCDAHLIPYSITGKVIVATREDELAGLERLAQRAEAHGLAFDRVGRDGLLALEPNADGLAALHVHSTGIVDYRAVLRALAGDLVAAGGTLKMSTEVTGAQPTPTGHRVITNHGTVSTRFLVTCAGLQSDRVTRASGAAPNAQIVPFKGEYFELRHDRSHLVNTLIYPVPDPNFPFLGVHLTKGIEGHVHAGPNAVLALRREGYGKFSFDARDTWETLSYPGFRRLARKHWKAGAQEMARSWSKHLFLKSLQRLVPAVEAEDLIAAPPGIRAQAVTPAGGLVDDFLLITGDHAVHVCNAPSPAATASLAIGETIAARVDLPRSSR